MFRKAVSLFTLAAFVLMSASCVTVKTKTVVAPSDLPGKGAKVRSVVTASGERIEFSPRDPGRVRGDAITGTARARYKVPVEIQGPFSSVKRRPDGSVYEITDGGGRVYPVVGVSKEGEAQWTILVNDMTARQVSVPLSDVRQIDYKSTNALLTALAAGIVVTLGLVIAFGLAAANME